MKNKVRQPKDDMSIRRNRMAKRFDEIEKALREGKIQAPPTPPYMREIKRLIRALLENKQN